MFRFYDLDFTQYDNMRIYDEGDSKFEEVGEYEVELVNPYYPMNYGMRSTNQSSPPGLPPSFIPSKNQAKTMHSGGPSTLAIDAGGIRPCKFRFTYIWQTNGRSYWSYITFVGRRSISGFRWMNRRWVYFGLDLNRIESFFC
ncbi:hypothetical protein KQI89_01685 [Clostridium sp. MSJ-4]|uniref:Uncharacterized protein n=1 Tax=Clostridium simiarum TaxID=2841506 RepID=A0ABS6EW78_9CLOT|nr:MULTISPECIES: hypothetical protein [Clostridium]MBU5590466.1 hypothetical protein [Clostridium simiarum]